MYESYFRLREPAFNVTPNPRFFYANSSHREAFATLSYGVERRKGIIVITGEAGTGKTTLLRRFVQNPGPTIHLSYIVDPHLNFIELLRCASDAFGLAQCPDRLAMIGQLNRYLREQFKKDHIVALLFDEAQDLNDEVLEELRLLSDLENGGEKLVQIVLVGQPDLRDALEDPTLEQLRQRVTVRYHIDPLDPPETTQYINHRLKRAALGAPLEFPSDVTSIVHARSGGVPRLINVICDAVLLCGYAEESHQIDLPLVRSAIDELESSSVLRRSTGTSGNGSGGTSAKPVAPAMPQPTAFRAEPAAPPPAMSAQPVRSIAPPAATPAHRPAAAAPPVDLPLHQPAPARPPVARMDVRQQPARPTSSIPIAHARPAPPKPAVFRPEPARHASAWNWMKTVILGLPSEEGRH